jgi:hypothetical protein
MHLVGKYFLDFICGGNWVNPTKGLIDFQFASYKMTNSNTSITLA